MDNINKLNLKDEDLKILRENFIMKYSKKKGWDPEKLTTSQMMEIVSSKEYKNPGLILG
jgi:hypothetical protein